MLLATLFDIGGRVLIKHRRAQKILIALAAPIALAGLGAADVCSGYDIGILREDNAQSGSASWTIVDTHCKNIGVTVPASPGSQTVDDQKCSSPVFTCGSDHAISQYHDQRTGKSFDCQDVGNPGSCGGDGRITKCCKGK